MRSRSLYPCLAALLLLGVAAIAFRRGDRGDAPRPALARVSSAVPVSPDSVGPGTVAAIQPTPSRPSPSPVSATAPATSSADEEVAIPTALPESPTLAKELSRDGTVRDYREVYTYQLGLMAFYQKCMRGRIARGLIYYYIKWDVDENHVASSPFFDPAPVPSEGAVTPEDELAFAACVKEYLATHDRLSLPHGGENGEAWGMRAVFPVQESMLLKLIAEAKAKAEAPPRAPSR